MTMKYCLLKQNQFMFSVVYRPPSGNVNLFLAFLDKLLCHDNECKYYLFVGGDLNINLLNDTSNASELLLLLTANNFYNVINHPTRTTLVTSTLIDLFITNFDKEKVRAGVVSSDISDHLPIFMLIDTAREVCKRNSDTMTIQNITQATLDTFRQKLMTTDWADVFHSDDVDTAYNTFIKKFKQLYSDCFPDKTIKIAKKGRKPWMTPTLFKKTRRKYQLYQIFLSTREKTALEQLKKYRNQLTREIRKSKKLYYSNLFDVECRKKSRFIMETYKQCS
uniref:Putative outcast ele5 orf1-h 1e-40-j 4 n=1 Tax=Ixodes ricinus TaxID=34613 RepID=A0A0K8RKJ0_IXORI